MPLVGEIKTKGVVLGDVKLTSDQDKFMMKQGSSTIMTGNVDGVVMDKIKMNSIHLGDYTISLSESGDLRIS